MEDIGLAVNEAMSNAVRHAYAPGTGCVHVSVESDESTFAVVVRDDGRGFDTGEKTRTSEDGGFGLRLIEQLAREFAVVTGPDQGTELRMVFALGYH